MLKPTTGQIELPEIENQILRKWNDESSFEASNEMRSSEKSFSFYDGPPFANGLPHYGHLLANTVKDTVPRYWNMLGYRVERRFGWDCHGLPVEFEIEKREKLSGRTDILNLGVGTFNEMCRESVLHYADEWQRVITRLGRWVDWNHQYRTMDPQFMESVWWVFSQLFKSNLVYKGFKVVPYSPRITAVLSNFEANQNYKEVQDPALTVKFKSLHNECYFLAWTTTPWTLVSNLALAVNPKIEYVKILDLEQNQEYILAKERLESVYPAKKGVAAFKVLETMAGSALIGQSYHPLFPHFKDHPHSFKVIGGDFVTTESGTGIVHCAPAFGEDDNRVCLENNIGIVDPLDEEARFTSVVPEFQGMRIKDADKEIIKGLKQQGAVLRHDTIVHSYPFCERTDEPLIYRSIPTWFVRVESIKERMLANNEKILWVPGHLKHGRMGKWLENARDWAISRNRFWGTPIPIWVCSNDQEHMFVAGSIKELEQKIAEPVPDIHKHFIDHKTFNCEHCSGTMRRIPEVFDCWFESGSMPYAQIHYPFENQQKFSNTFPADFIAEGLDQTRGWFYTLAVLSSALFDKPAFKNVVVNGLVLAEDGRKMSKRWRNYTSPEELIETFGADSVRLYMLNSSILRGEDLKFKDQGVKDTTRTVLLPLINAYSFLSTYADADKWMPDKEQACGQIPHVSGLLDRWIISRFQSLVSQVQVHMEAYQLYNVIPAMIEFIDDLTNWYIRLSRRRFWAGEANMSQETKDAYGTLFYILDGFLKAFAPFAPFLSEYLYGLMHDGNSQAPSSVHHNSYPLPRLEHRDVAMEVNMNLVRRVTELGRSLRAKHQIKTRQVLPGILIITRNASDQSLFQHCSDLIKAELNIKKIEFSTDETNFVNLSLKPNLKTLGKTLGKDLRSFQTHLAEVNAEKSKVSSILNELESNATYTWQGYALSIDDFMIQREPMDSRLIASTGGVTVLLDTNLDDQLIAEGLAREVVNRIQSLRRDAGLKVSDRITLTIACTSTLQAAIAANVDYVLGEVLGGNLKFVEFDDPVFAQLHQEKFLIDSDDLSVGIKVV